VGPDLVLFMTDQQRADQVGYASGGHFETPNLDALAGRGVVFDVACSASTVCVPSRNALLTGVQPHRLPTQENGIALREGCWTVAHALRRAGYRTALVGKMHFTPVHAAHGFDHLRLAEHLEGQGFGPLSHERGDTTDDYRPWLAAHGADDPDHAHPTPWVEREAARVLAERDPDRPLFLVVSFPHPHAPYDPPPPYDTMYDPADSRLPATGYDANEGLPLVQQLATAASTTRDEAADPDAVRRFLATVRGLVRQIDDSVGRLLDRIDLDRTVVAFTADHGDFAGHRGLMRKNPWMPFEDLVRVPMVVAGHGVAGGRHVTTPVQSFDLAPTLLDLAGVDVPAGADLDGRSLRPVLDGTEPDGDPDRTVVAGTTIGWPMARRSRFKYFVHDQHGLPVLFDLDADPDERVNLAGDPALAAVEADLAAELAAALARPPFALTADA
jgi:choline-sulfatase